TDTHLEARSAAYRALGLLGSSDAIELLDSAAKSQNLIERQNAIRGLAMINLPLVVSYLNDDEVKVRQTAVEELLRKPDAAQVINIRKQLLHPRNDLHMTVIEGLKDWPDSLALPIYLYGLQECPILTSREACLEAIQQRSETRESFPIEAAVVERRVEAEKWADRHQIPKIDMLASTKAAKNSPPESEPDAREQELNSNLQKLADKADDGAAYQESLMQLTQLSEEGAVLLERVMKDQPESLQLDLRTKVLPEIHPVYRAIAQLQSPQITVRRQGANQLRTLSERRSLPVDMFPTIRDQMIKEQDQLVWRSMLAAYQRDRTPQAAEMARIALHHAWPDIRLLGCQYIEFDPKPEYAEWLRPLMHDRQNRPLRLKAIQLVGQCRNPNLLQPRYPQAEQQQREEQGLIALLNETEPDLRFEVIAAASRLGYQPAMLELMYLGQHPEAQARAQAVTAMGESGQTRFAKQLLLIGATELDPIVRREILASLQKLTTFGTAPPSDIHQYQYEQQLKIWGQIWNPVQQQTPNQTASHSSLNTIIQRY
ncbi:MAG: hypothetical protein KDA65_13665, partial [Planctomycetaceae bacterium]|nr:hypothetical protein [Planctomycetaceae bacterium]